MDSESALEKCQDVLSSLKCTLGTKHPYTIACESEIADILIKLERADDALVIYDDIIPISEHILGVTHPQTLDLYNDKGTALASQAKYEESLRFFLLAATNFDDKKKGDIHPSTPVIFDNIGATYQVLKQYEEAKTWYHRALESKTRIVGLEHPDTLKTLDSLSQLHQTIGEYDTALEYQEQIVSINERVSGIDDLSTLAAIQSKAVILQDQCRLEEAMPLFARVLEGYEREYGPDDKQTSIAMSDMAMTLSDFGNYEQALELLERAIEVRLIELDVDHHLVLQELHRKAYVLSNLFRFDDAIDCLHQVVKGSMKLPDLTDLQYQACKDLTVVYYNQRKYHVAIKQAESLLFDCNAKYGPENDKVKSLNKLLNWFTTDQGAKHKHRDFQFQRKPPQDESDDSDNHNTLSMLDIIQERVMEESRVRLAEVQVGLGIVWDKTLGDKVDMEKITSTGKTHFKNIKGFVSDKYRRKSSRDISSKE